MSLEIITELFLSRSSFSNPYMGARMNTDRYKSKCYMYANPITLYKPK